MTDAHLGTESITIEISGDFKLLSCLDAGKLLFQWPLPDGLATLGDGDFTAALEAQLEDICACKRLESAHPQRHEPERVPSLPDSEEFDSCEEWQQIEVCHSQQQGAATDPAVSASAAAEALSLALSCQSQRRALPREAPLEWSHSPESPQWQEGPDSWGEEARLPTHPSAWPLWRAQSPPPSPAAAAEYRVFVTNDASEWPALPPAAPPPVTWQARPQAVPRRQGAIARLAVERRHGDMCSGDARFAEALQELEVMETQGYHWLPSKEEQDEAHRSGSYHAGAYLLTIEEREREVERGSLLARRASSAAATADDMRRMMTKRGEQQPREEEHVTTKDATDRVHSGKHLQRSMIEAGWRPAPGKKHPKWKKDFNGVTLSIFHASTPGDRRHIDGFAAKLQRMERNAYGI